MTFQLILNHPAEPGFTYPDGFDDDIRAICDKLFLQEPSERIGCGADDADGNGYAALMSSALFSGKV